MGRGRQGKGEREGKAQLGYLSGGSEFLVTPATLSVYG